MLPARRAARPIPALCLAAVACAASTPQMPAAPPLAVAPLPSPPVKATTATAATPATATSARDAAESSARLRDVSDRAWTALLETTALPLLGEGGLGGPLFATSVGDHRFDGRIDDATLAAHARLVEALSALRTEADALPSAGLAGEDAITLSLLRELLADPQAAEVCQGLAWVVDAQAGWQTVLPTTHLYYPLGTAKGAAELAARYGQAGRLFDQWIASLRDGLARGLTTPRTNLKAVLAQLDALLAKDAAHSDMLPAPERFAGLPKAQRAAARDGIEKALAESVLPGLQRFRDFLQSELLPKARSDVGLWALPGGDACYRVLVRYQTGTDRTPQELHDLGLAELAKIEAEQEVIAKSQGAATDKDGHVDLVAFTNSLAKRKDQFKLSGDLLLDWNKATLARALAALPQAFARMPRRPIETRAIEAYRAPGLFPAFAQPAPDDGSQPAIYYVNTYKPETRALYNEEALCFHEAAPGHLYQADLAQDLHGLPDFRRQLGPTAYIEGWALYSERLADETLHLYSGPLARYGMLGYQAWRASRLVVDTGMHALHWDRERALLFLRAHTTLSADEAANEIDRYVIMPAQALAYLVGEQEIFRLRARAKDRLGDAMDLREFHEVVLGHGAISFRTLEGLVDEWLARKSPVSPAQVPPAQAAPAQAPAPR